MQLLEKNCGIIVCLFLFSVFTGLYPFMKNQSTNQQIEIVSMVSTRLAQNR